MSVQPAPEAAANAPSPTVANTTLWTLNLHVIPNLPLCFSNYARPGTKYAVPQSYLGILL